MEISLLFSLKSNSSISLFRGFVADRGVLEIDSSADLKWLACISYL